MLLAHSAKLIENIPAQTYANHVNGVVSKACDIAKNTAIYSTITDNPLCHAVCRAAEYHDLGKLDDENQAVLKGVKKAKNLPVQHTDAGAAFLLDYVKSAMDAVLVRSHHIGLPDWIEEGNRGELLFRDQNEEVRNKVNHTLDCLIKSHHSSGVKTGPNFLPPTYNGTPSTFLRLALSCLADADHSDTAIHYGNYSETNDTIALRPDERLSALDNYVSTLGDKSDRSTLRSEMYVACRDGHIPESIASCDSPVGTGKTTAVMAHLLSQAKKRGLRRIIIVLPFTNIITQSVSVYRNALVLSGEDPDKVVAELHHRADFQDIDTRHLTALWKAPIIVTTAVSFFETLASNTPATLRRLHNLPGSAIFIDESHAALPAKLLPIAWLWIKKFAEEWSVYWVLASGSLTRFWLIPEIDNGNNKIPEIVPEHIRFKLSSYETNRIKYCYHPKPFDMSALINFVDELPGPRLIILNTVQSAAAVAQALKEKYSHGKVEHLSTTLIPHDRDNTLKRVKLRLQDRNDVDWTLVATSCVEAGVDISFRTGIRELGSLVSLLQTAGRVNRHGAINNAEIWTIRLAETGLLKQHPGIKDAAKVLKDYCDNNILIEPNLCTGALTREIRLAGDFSTQLCTYEEQLRFPQVEKDFRVISSDTRLVIVNPDLVQRLEKFEKIDWREIQMNSVQIWGYRLRQLDIKEIHGHTGLYKWHLDYDKFIGCMAGILKIESFVKFADGAGII